MRDRFLNSLAVPGSPLYSHRLSNAVEVLERLETDWVDRRTLQETMGVSKWTAWRILKRCGAAEGPGGSLICGRAELIRSLRELQQDDRIAPEIARRRRVESYLDGMVQYASRKQKEIARGGAARN